MYQTHREIKRKKRIKRGIYGLVIFATIWVAFGLYLNLTNNEYKKLENIGYSNIEISIINDILTKKEIKYIYNYEYIESLTDLLVSNDFQSNKLNNYLTYYTKYPDINNDELIYIINNDFDELEYNDFNKEIIFNEEFDKEKMNRYNDYYNKYKLSIEDTLYAVNNNLDEYDIKYDKKYLKFIDKDYAILSNLERYNNYYNKMKYKNINDIISEVNSNLDLKPYTDSIKANTSLNEQILVNKYYYLSSDYEPNDLVDIDKSIGNGKIKKDVYEAFNSMYEDAKKNNVNLYIIKSYISYSEQQKLYYRNKYYYEKAGYSENQTGYMIEITYNNWLNDNAYKYGFILRFPENKKSITGYSKNNYYRYVGKDIAKFIYENDISFEEYYAYFIDTK